MSARAAAARRRRTAVASSAVITLFALVLTAFALRYPGLQSSDIDVSNGGVWVTNRSEGFVGRLNVDAEELDARLSLRGDDLDIVQSGYVVLAVGARGYSVLNTASVLRGGVVELPPESSLALGGDRVAIAAADGRVWILTPEQAAAFTPGGVEPVHEASGSAVEVTVTTSGTVFVLDGDQLHTFPRGVDTAKPETRDPITVSGISTREGSVALTAVAEQPVVLDREQRLLRLGTELRTVDLTSSGVADASGVALQQPGGDSDQVVLATTDSLLQVPMDGGTPVAHPAGGTGTPAAPAQVAGCSYGAWNGSQRYLRLCEGAEPASGVVPEATASSELVLRVNRDLVVLNDHVEGFSWMIRDDMTMVDDWVITQDIQQNDKEKETETVTSTITDVEADRDQENRPPTANDDEYGVRAGANVVLPVTRNDSDPDGDVLLAELSGEQPGIGTVTPIRGGTQLQIAVEDSASGTATFTYQVEDGRGGTDTATVTLTVHPPSQNTAPVPADQAIRVQVLSGSTVTLNVLPYWEDPEGDAFYLADASIAPEDLLSFRADGTVTLDDAGLVIGTKQITLTFRDEHGKTSEDVLEVESVTDTELEPITTTDHVQVVAGRSATFAPMANDINPAGGSLELTHVDEVEGLEIDADLVTGSVSVSGAEGTYYVGYTVSAPAASSRGLIRIDVVPPGRDAMLPVAVDDMGLVTTGGDTLLDPLENDVDPTGGVLVLGSVELPEGSGLKATVVGHHLVRVEASPGAEVTEEPVPLTYEVANSTGSSTGTIRVMLARTDTQFANPVGAPDEAVVRAGDMVLVDVLDNDLSPTNSDLHLGDLTDIAGSEDLGQAELHDQQIRFSAAPDASGEATLTYEVVDETGRSGAARLTVRIVPIDASNAPPRPENLVARAVAGAPVRIPVSTTGIDPDGDSVMLMGISDPVPELGEVTSATGHWIEYVPFEGSVGTDRFRYQVMDRSGAVGTAEVLIGTAAPSEQNQPPYAVDDVIDVRPEREVQAQVLENDSDPEGDALTLLHETVSATTDLEVVPQAEGERTDLITVVTPAEAGTHPVLHEISDGQLSSAATLTVRVDPNAPLRAPVAIDDFVDPRDVLDPEMTEIQVDVLANDRDPDGSINDLEVELLGDGDVGEGSEGGEDAVLDESGILTLVPSAQQQRLRYRITDVDGQSSTGYVWVPGTSMIAPVWAGGTLEVVAGSELSIDLSDPLLVRVRPGAAGAQILDAATVSAEHTDGSQLVVDQSTLSYRPAEDFAGRDSISLEVSDGPAGDATAASGQLVIPIEVLPGDTNLPPTFRGASLELEQGGAATTFDLTAAAEDPDGDDLRFALAGAELPVGVSIAVDGSTLTASASAEAVRGASVEVPVTVTDGSTDPVSADFQLLVGGSKRPLPSAVLDNAEIDAGRTASLPVLANDSNPFPGDPLTLVSAQLINGEGSVDISGDQVVITPDEDFAGVLSASYIVDDQTGDPERRVSGEILATVRGKPAAPSVPRIGQVGDGSVELVFTAGDDNGAPITGYTVTSATGPAVSRECPSTSCTLTGLANGSEYTFQVIAHNEVGDSPISAPSAPATPDVRPEPPGAPAVTRGDGGLTVDWRAPVNKGSALQEYTLQMQISESGALKERTVDAATMQVLWEPLRNGEVHRFRVRASNLSEQPSEWSDWSVPEHPAGVPKKLPGKVTAERVNDPLGGGMKVSWPAADDDTANGEDITSYIVTSSDGTSETADADATSHTFHRLDPNTSYSFTVTAVNVVGRGAVSSSSNEVVPFAVPEAPTQVTATLPSEGEGEGPNGTAAVSWEHAEDNGTPIKEYVIRWDGGSKTVDGEIEAVRITGLDNGTAYRFTVQARNRFAGGESAPSAPTASVTPYAKPGTPVIKADDSGFICHSPGNCRIAVYLTRPADSGGVPFKHVVVEPQGLSCNRTVVSSSNMNTTCEPAESTTYTVTAYAVNEKGLKSETVTHTFTTPAWGDVPYEPISITIERGAPFQTGDRIMPQPTDFGAVNYEWRSTEKYAWTSIGGTGAFTLPYDPTGEVQFFIRGVDAEGKYSELAVV
ncbi:Ig-like domain-containing protein [Brachybacterium sp. AOP29-B2-41]|uniref:Ig-like domain-containing protein n=1 Tax=Brachybacterium sp. AOP29-B2-41 TaxID=3457704 RepID=UPI004034B402